MAIPISVVAAGTVATSSGATFTFSTLGSGSLALVNSGSYQLQIVSGTGVTAGFYPLLSWSPMQKGPGGYNVGTAPTYGAATTCVLASSPGTSGTGITWNLVQNANVIPGGMLTYPTDNNGYCLTQMGGMTLGSGSVTCTSTASAYQLSAASVPCKMVMISPSVTAASIVTVGASTSVAGGSGIYLQTTSSTQPPAAVLQVSDLSQVWVNSTHAADVIGYVYFT